MSLSSRHRSLTQIEFEEIYPSFYADFGSRGTVRLPTEIKQETVLADLLSGQESLADQAIEVSQSHLVNKQYYCQISYRASVIGCFNCTQWQYDNGIVPTEAINAVETFGSAAKPGAD